MTPVVLSVGPARLVVAGVATMSVVQTGPCAKCGRDVVATAQHHGGIPDTLAAMANAIRACAEVLCDECFDALPGPRRR